MAHPDARLPRQVDDWLWAAFEVDVRRDTFDRLRASHTSLAGRVTTDALIDTYRSHRPAIALLPGVSDLLTRLHSQGYRLGVLSDGPFASQSAKAQALGLRRWFDPIVLTASREADFRKPSTGGFEWIANRWHLPHAELAYIGDNPEKDFVGPRALGWRIVRFRLSEQLTFALERQDPDNRPDAELADLGAAVDFVSS